jgi:hypothetical protein
VVTKVVKEMETGPDAHDKWDEHEFYEDLITLFYIFILLVCVLFGHSAYACLYVIVLVNVASILCNLCFPIKKTECLVPGSAVSPRAF